MPQLDQVAIFNNIFLFFLVYTMTYMVFYNRIFKTLVFSYYIRRRWKKKILFRLISCAYSLPTVYRNGLYLKKNFQTKFYSSAVLMFDPLEQFEAVCYSCAYSSKQFWFLIFVIVSAMTVMSFKFCETSGRRRHKTYTKGFNTLQILEQYAFITFVRVYKDLIVDRRALKYLPVYLFSFLFIFFSNIIGLLPFSYTLTSSIVITFFLSAQFFIGTLIITFSLHRSRTYQSFLPEGVPLEIAPFLVVIELISYFARLFSLAIRLFANLMAGHSLMKILIGFVWTIFLSGGSGSILFIFPLAVVFLVTCLEIAIAFLQAYVFTVLSLIYLNDGIVLH